MDHEAFNKMRAVGRLTARCLDELKSVIKPGITTKDIEAFVVEFQEKHGLTNAQYGYLGFPGYCCTSVNDVVCHGIPSEEVVLQEGDIVKVDVTFSLDGWHGDSCYTYAVGEITPEVKNLVDVAKAAMYAGAIVAQPGALIFTVAKTINDYVESQGYSVVKDYHGHCIGLKMHMMPLVPHAPTRQKGITNFVIQPGMFFTIEPMINIGKAKTYEGADGWTVKTRDGSLSAQWEVTLGIHPTYNEIFTICPPTETELKN